MSLRLAEYFVAVAEERHFGRPARQAARAAALDVLIFGRHVESDGEMVDQFWGT